MCRGGGDRRPGSASVRIPGVSGPARPRRRPGVPGRWRCEGFPGARSPAPDPATGSVHRRQAPGLRPWPRPRTGPADPGISSAMRLAIEDFSAQAHESRQRPLVPPGCGDGAESTPRHRSSTKAPASWARQATTTTRSRGGSSQELRGRILARSTAHVIDRGGGGATGARGSAPAGVPRLRARARSASDSVAVARSWSLCPAHPARAMPSAGDQGKGDHRRVDALSRLVDSGFQSPESTGGSPASGPAPGGGRTIAANRRPCMPGGYISWLGRFCACQSRLADIGPVSADWD